MHGGKPSTQASKFHKEVETTDPQISILMNIGDNTDPQGLKNPCIESWVGVNINTELLKDLGWHDDVV